MKYLPQNLVIQIYIAKDDISSTDKVKIYETTSDTTLIATLSSSEVADDPSQTGDAYLFTCTKQITTPGDYAFYYTVIDSYGNESASVNTFDKSICLTPRTPAPLTIAEIDDTHITFTL